MSEYVTCKFCYGKGKIYVYKRELYTKEEKRFRTFCPQCNGSGRILWIDEIMGRNIKRRKRHLKRTKEK